MIIYKSFNTQKLLQFLTAANCNIHVVPTSGGSWAVWAVSQPWLWPHTPNAIQHNWARPFMWIARGISCQCRSWNCCLSIYWGLELVIYCINILFSKWVHTSNSVQCWCVACIELHVHIRIPRHARNYKYKVKVVWESVSVHMEVLSDYTTGDWLCLCSDIKSPIHTFIMNTMKCRHFDFALYIDSFCYV